MAENNPNLRKETGSKIQKGQEVPNKMNPKRPTQAYLPNTKDKEIILKAARRKQFVT